MHPDSPRFSRVFPDPCYGLRSWQAGLGRIWSMCAARPLELSEDSFRIAVVDFFQHIIGQSHPIDLPTSLPGISRVVEILILCLQPPEEDPIHGGGDAMIRSKQNSVLKLQI